MTNNVEVAGTAVLPDSVKAAPHAKLTAPRSGTLSCGPPRP